MHKTKLLEEKGVIMLWEQLVLGIIPGKEQTLHYFLWSATPP